MSNTDHDKRSLTDEEREAMEKMPRRMLNSPPKPHKPKDGDEARE